MDDVIKEETAVSVQKYLYGYVVIGLCVAVVYLLIMYKDLNNFIRDTYTKQNAENVRVIERNTDALNTFIITLRQTNNK